MKYKFNLTCPYCPEQYDVYDGDELIADVRYRYGNSIVHPYFKGLQEHFDLYSGETTFRKKINFDITIYEENIGNEFDGMFEEKDRDKILNKIDNEILKYMNNEKEKSNG